MSKYDTIEVVEKGIDEVEIVEKFNPFHDALGRFASANGFASYSANPNTKAGAMAIGRSYAAGHKKTVNSHANSKGGTIDDNYWWKIDGEEFSAAVDSGQKYTQQKLKQEQKQKQKQEKLKNPPVKQKKPKTETEDTNNSAKQTKHRSEEKLTGSDAENAVMKDTGVDRQTAAKMVESVRRFSGFEYSDIRSYQATGHPPGFKDVADSIEDFIAKSPKWEGGTLYRGIDIDKATAKTLIAGMKKGKAISQNGMSSWSSSESVARSFATADVSWEGASIIFKTSSAKSGTSIRHLSKFPREDEVLVSSTAKWKATKITQKKNGDHITYTVECEEI